MMQTNPGLLSWEVELYDFDYACYQRSEMVKSYSEIEKIEKNCINFIDGTKIQFDECIRRDTNMCIAERDITATPPFFFLQEIE